MALKLLNKTSFFFCLVCLTLRPLHASSMSEVSFSQTTIKNDKLGIEFVIVTDNDGQLESVRFKKNEVVYSVPQALLEDSGKQVSASGLRIMAPSVTSLEKGDVFANFVISFPCGKVVLNEDEKAGYTFYSRDEVWFQFQSGSFVARGRCVSAGDLLRKWTEYVREDGANEVIVKTIRGSVMNPFGRDTVRRIDE
jgi:hypothetical protein